MVQIDNVKRAVEVLHAIVERHLNEVDNDVFVKIAGLHKSSTVRFFDAAHNAVSGIKSGKVWDWQALEKVHNLANNCRELGTDVDKIVSNWKTDLAHIERAVSAILEELEK